jgi:hypothetical protein
MQRAVPIYGHDARVVDDDNDNEVNNNSIAFKCIPELVAHDKNCTLT